MAKRLALCLLCLCVLSTCGPPKYKKQIVEDPLFPDNYIVRDPVGQQIGYAVKISQDEYRLFTTEGRTIILKDPIIEGGYLIFDEEGGD